MLNEDWRGALQDSVDGEDPPVLLTTSPTVFAHHSVTEGQKCVWFWGQVTDFVAKHFVGFPLHLGFPLLQGGHGVIEVVSVDQAAMVGAHPDAVPDVTALLRGEGAVVTRRSWSSSSDVGCRAHLQHLHGWFRSGPLVIFRHPV